MSGTVVIEQPETPYDTAMIPRAQMSEIAMIDRTTHEFHNLIIEAEDQGNSTQKAFLIARATRALQKLLTPDLMDDIMALQGTPLGFRTDRDKANNGVAGYPVDVVRDVVIQALMNGFQVTGNQINIIGGNLYVTKEGFENRLKNFEGLTNIEVDFEVPDTASRAGTALVSCVARWRFNGKLGELTCTRSTKGDFRIPVRVNNGQGDDAILGKAKSKLYRKVFERLTGMHVGALEDDGSIDAESVANVVEDAASIQTKTTVADAASIGVQKVEDASSVHHEAKQPVEPQPLDMAVEEELKAALFAIKNRNQFDACKSHWRTKAKNREFTDGQMQTIGDWFAAREAQGFA